MYLTKLERLEIVLDIAKKLKNFQGKRGEIINLYDEQYSFVSEFKKITKQYIDMDDMNVMELKGTLYFEEIDKNIDYILPAKNYKKSLFVIRGKK
jgi:hypothetical protein